MWGGIVFTANSTGDRLFSTGMVNLVDGAYVVPANQNCYIGGITDNVGGTNGMAILRQSGGRAKVSGSSTAVYVGYCFGTVGVIDMTGGTAWYGGVLRAGGTVNSTGMVQVAGGTFAAAKEVTLGYAVDSGGFLYHSGGGMSLSNDLYIGYAAGSTGGLVAAAPTPLHVEGALQVGYGGSAGEVTVRSNALCTAGSVTLKNAGVPSRLRFEACAEGTGMLVARDGVTIEAGARLEVDVTGYKGDAVWLKLIACGGIRSGMFAAEDITVTGYGTVRQDIDQNVWLHRLRGTFISVR